MSDEWHFYRWNFDRYATIRPQLRAAVRAETFASLSDTEEGTQVAEMFAEGEIPLLEAKSAWLTAECRLGDPIVFNAELPRFLNRIERKREGEEIAEILSELLFARVYLEQWLEQTSICGILPPIETARLSGLCRDYLQKNRTEIGAVRGGFFRRVFERNATPDEIFPLLCDLVNEAVKAGNGTIAYQK